MVQTNPDGAVLRYITVRGAVDVQRQHLDAEPPPPSEPGPPAYTILVVDDNLLIRKMIGSGLEKIAATEFTPPLRVNVLEAENGSAALAIAGSEPVDLAMVDVYMPVMDGRDFISQLRRLTKGRTPALAIVTSSQDPVLRRKLLEAGADMVATACPLCQYNLGDRQDEVKKIFRDFESIPVVYYTQLMALAFDLDGEATGFDQNLPDPRPVLEERGLI